MAKMPDYNRRFALPMAYVVRNGSTILSAHDFKHQAERALRVLQTSYPNATIDVVDASTLRW